MEQEAADAYNREQAEQTRIAIREMQDYLTNQLTSIQTEARNARLREQFLRKD